MAGAAWGHGGGLQRLSLMHSREQTRFWQASALSGVELLQARYLEQRFAPHVHEGFVFTVI